jgi:hypothetical protein
MYTTLKHYNLKALISVKLVLESAMSAHYEPELEFYQRNLAEAEKRVNSHVIETPDWYAPHRDVAKWKGSINKFHFVRAIWRLIKTRIIHQGCAAHSKSTKGWLQRNENDNSCPCCKSTEDCDFNDSECWWENDIPADERFAREWYPEVDRYSVEFSPGTDVRPHTSACYTEAYDGVYIEPGATTEIHGLCNDCAEDILEGIGRVSNPNIPARIERLNEHFIPELSTIIVDYVFSNRIECYFCSFPCIGSIDTEHILFG